MKYKCIPIKETGEETEVELNRLAELGWELVCSYAWNTQWLILKKNE